MAFHALLLAATLAQEVAPRDEKSAYVEIYDVRDLASGARRVAFAGDEAPDAQDGVRADDVAWKLLAVLVQCEAAGAPERDPDFNCTTKPGGALVVHGRSATHERIRRRLLALHRREPRPLEVEIRVLELGPEQRAALVELENPKSDHPELAVAQIESVTPATVERLVKSGVNLALAPDVVTLALEPFELRTGEECSYVASYDLVSIEGLGRIADPVVKTLHEGLTIQGRVVAALGAEPAQDAPFALRLEVESSVLKRPIARTKTDLGEIQLPELKHVTIATTVAGALGRTFLVGGVPKPSFDPKDEALRVYLLVTVRASSPRAEPPPADRR